MVTNRRLFLKNTATKIAASALIPHFWIQKASATLPNVLLGHGSHRYKVIQDWGQLDSGKNPVNDCHEMVEDSQGRLYLLTNETKNNLLVYDRSGSLLQSWGNSYPGAHGLSLSNEGEEQFLFLTDTNRSQVIKTTLDGVELLKIDYPKETGEYAYPGQFKPTETVIHPETGDIYVVDGYGLNYVIQYSSKGEYIRHFGGFGDSDGTFRCCHGITIDFRNSSQPSLIITDRSNMQLKRFSMEGEYLSSIPVPGSFICRPVIKGKYMYAAVYRSTSESVANSGYITVFDQNDQVISTPGGTAPVYLNGQLQEQSKDNSFTGFMHPHDVCIDGDENIYVPQWASQKTYPLKLVRV